MVICLPLEFLPVSGPTERWCDVPPTFGEALLCNSRVGSDLGLNPYLITFFCRPWQGISYRCVNSDICLPTFIWKLPMGHGNWRTECSLYLIHKNREQKFRHAWVLLIPICYINSKIDQTWLWLWKWLKLKNSYKLTNYESNAK